MIQGAPPDAPGVEQCNSASPEQKPWIVCSIIEASAGKVEGDNKANVRVTNAISK
jgi:hypothetical protein